MAIKRKGILAQPGTYKYGEVEETKTAEELKQAAIRQPIIMLTNKHRPGGIPYASDFIGTVSQKWNEEKQKIEGDFWFYDEFITPQLRAKLEQNSPIPISMGSMLEEVEDGIQKGIYYTHVAVLEEEDPICPVNECGVNVRMESNSGNIRLEQSTEINKPEKPPEDAPKESEPVKVEEKYATVEDLSALKQEILDAISGLKTPEEPKPEPPPTPAQVEAETQIPADTGSASKFGPGIEVQEDGWLKIVPTKRNKESE